MFKQFRKFLTTFGRGYRRATFFVVAGSLVSAFFELMGVVLIFPLMGLVVDPEMALNQPQMKQIYSLLGSPQIPLFVILLSLGIGGVYIVKAVFQVLFLRFEHKMLSNWKTNICYRLFQRYLETDYSFHLQRNSAELIGIITSDVPYIINNYFHHFVLLISNLTVALGLIGFLSYQYTLITFGVVVVFSILFFVQSRVIESFVSSLGRETSLSSAQNYAALQQGLTAYKETKINLRERFFCQIFSEANEKKMKTEGKLLFFQNLPIVTTEMIVILAMIMAFDILMLSPRSSSVTVDLAVLVMAVFRMVPLVNRAITSVSLIQSSQDPLNKLFAEAGEIGYEKSVEVEEIPDEMSSSPLELEKALKLDSVSYTYPTASLAALKDISLTVSKGDFVGVIGPSGSGKTTLMGILLGFLHPQTGSYTIDITKITDENLRALRRTIGYVDQQPFIFDVSITENVAFGVAPDKIDHSRVEKALKQAELWDSVCALENGVQTLVGENGKRLSGGQRQRLAIARALYKDPSILVLDEATSALDVETEHRISETIGKLKGKLTIIAIAHRLSTLRMCDRLIMMMEGQISQEGTYDSLLRTSPAFGEIVRMSQVRNSDN